MKHALVIGGSGMLANVSLSLLLDGYYVSVIARNQSRLNQLSLKTEHTSNLRLISVDYHDEQMLQSEVKKAIIEHGPLDLIVSWIHSTAPHALEIIIGENVKKNNDFRLFHIAGSRSNLQKIKEQINIPSHCHYRQVQLGFVLEGNHSRWLTHGEISQGVIEAINKDSEVTVIGVLEPWDKRPN